ncbi:tyrosine-protein phosphatase [Denitrificimonas caeni]|uniref:tyrosine-protein phosphatase n=1 Tax=Denitrificimonas caeni TaxID=521720 RepID=UPI001962A541|nr:CpsB/CapC family capsule biosynthesis tyrosine phosphatase [Denitrificimonas caeni]
MIDLHNHLLPGIDDGAPDLDTALQLAEMAVRHGTTHLVCTPHIHPGRYDNTPSTINQALALFQQGLNQHDIPLQVAAAAEVRFGMELMIGVKNKSIPFLGQWQGQNVMLLEFPHGEMPFGAERLTAWLLQQSIIPMIAHPERNKGLMRDPDKLNPFIQQGCLLQVTAGSVAGDFGEVAQELAVQWLEKNWVTILASDAHNLEHRPPILTTGLAAASEILGEDAARRLVIDNPWQIAQQHFN